MGLVVSLDTMWLPGHRKVQNMFFPSRDDLCALFKLSTSPDQQSRRSGSLPRYGVTRSNRLQAETIAQLESVEPRVMLSASPMDSLSIHQDAGFDFEVSIHDEASEYAEWRNQEIYVEPLTEAVGLDELDQQTLETQDADSHNLIELQHVFDTTSYRGTGYSIAVLDTGVDYNHANLGGGWGNRVIAGYDFHNNDADPMDDHGHGTHVAGIIGSDHETYGGIAPDVNIIALKVLGSDGSGSFGAVEDALQWVLDNQETYNIVGVNMSLGAGNFTSNPYTFMDDEMSALVDAGVFIATSSGNSFYSYDSEQGLGSPAISDYSVSVGAVYDTSYGQVSWGSGATDYTTAADRITSFTQRSNLLDILAPGALLTSTYVGGGFATMGGTSMASPVIAGAVALLHQAAIETGQSELANQTSLLELMQDTGASIFDGDDEDDNVDNTGLTFSRLDIGAAIDAILATAETPSGFVTVEGSTATVAGTDGADSFTLSINGNSLEINRNGEEATLDLTGITLINVLGDEGIDTFQFTTTVDDETVTFNAGSMLYNGSGFDLSATSFESMNVNSGGGNDQAILNGSIGDDTFVSKQNYSYMRGDSYDNQVNGFGTVVANATSGGMDRAYMYDTTGDDALVMGPTSTSLTSSTLSNTANDFDRVYAYSQNGGNNTATLNDSAGNDTLIVKPEYTYLASSAGINYAIGFVQTVGNSSAGGNDVAKFYDSEGDEQFTAQGNSATLLRNGVTVTANGYGKIYAYSSEGGNDTAVLNDTVGDDVFVSKVEYSYMKGTDYLNYVIGYNEITVNSDNGGYDRGYLHDSSEDDSLTITPPTATFNRGGVVNYLNNFDVVTIKADRGGNDSATLNDSAGDDSFRVQSNFSYLKGSNFRFYVTQFESVTMNSTSGGMDRAYLYDTAGDDSLTMDPYSVVQTTATQINTVNFFDRVYAYSQSGGNDSAVLNDSDGDDNFVVKPEYSYMAGSDYGNYLIGFNSVTAQADGLGTDRTYIYDSSAADMFFQFGSYGQYQSNSAIYNAHNFDRVRLTSESGGLDQIFTIEALESIFEAIGDWLYS